MTRNKLKNIKTHTYYYVQMFWSTQILILNDTDLNINNTLVSKIFYEDLSTHFAKYETPYSSTDLYIILHKTYEYTNDYDESKYLILIFSNERKVGKIQKNAE